jgi:hypothetical protein
MRKYTFLFTFFLITVSGYSQNLIGYKSSEIKDYMKKNKKEMTIENVVNNRYRYLKYTDLNDSQTLLFFLNADSVCKGIRLVCDRMTRNEKIKEFNSGYLLIDSNKWIDTLGRRRSFIMLDDDLWSSHFTIEPEKKDGSN